jgi:hypothetical protein
MPRRKPKQDVKEEIPKPLPKVVAPQNVKQVNIVPFALAFCGILGLFYIITKY